LLEVIARTRKPVIISTAGLTIEDIDNVVSYFSHKNGDFALMHCVGLYPTPEDMIQMGFLGKMIKRYPRIIIGYSGHEQPDNLDVVKIAISHGASILERHVGVPTDTITLNKYSMNPDQVDAWIGAALLAKKICGDTKHKRISHDEKDSLLSLKRGVYAVQSLKKGDTIEREHVFFAMPCQDGQLTSGEFGSYRQTFIASRDYDRNEPIFEICQPDAYLALRTILHDAKGMLYEAGIEFGNDCSVELSHHYGLEHFRQTGALIVNVMNREYCKKLLVMLPAQQHPNHRHKIKEETFQLLWGDLELDIEGKIHHMKPGDQILVERGQYHSFISNNGAVIEEISTTHMKNDSDYLDDRIAELDPMQRKTVLDGW
jgi:N-acetylneuraminate synthase